VLVDRGSGAAERLAQQGLRLHAVFDLPQLLDHWRQASAISAEQHQTVTQYLQQS
jgi:orotate phosphoribosyltransferase